MSTNTNKTLVVSITRDMAIELLTTFVNVFKIYSEEGSGLNLFDVFILECDLIHYFMFPTYREICPVDNATDSYVITYAYFKDKILEAVFNAFQGFLGISCPVYNNKIKYQDEYNIQLSIASVECLEKSARNWCSEHFCNPPPYNFQQPNHYTSDTLASIAHEGEPADVTTSRTKCIVCAFDNTSPGTPLREFYYSIPTKLNRPVCSACIMYEFNLPASDNNNRDYIEDEYSDIEDETSEDEYECSEDDSEDEPEKEFGCAGCDYEWRDGWKNGWKAAVKHMKKQLNLTTNPPSSPPPSCANCGMSRKTQRCGGSCGGTVRYCSVKCQRQDWNNGHKNTCQKM